MVDCGIAFQRLKEYLYDVDYLIITHIHTDHLRKSTYKKIRKMFPNIKVIGNYEVAQTVEVDYIANAGYSVKDLPFNLIPFECIHDVVTYGYIWTIEDKRIIYATDTHDLSLAPVDEPFDYLFIESNHDEKKIKMAKATKGYDPKVSAQRHMSTQKAKEFYYVNRKDKDSELIELHKSERFY